MKELSIEQKAERYDEIIDKFDVILNLNTVKESGTIFADDVRKIISELIKNEDEKIREQVVYAINQLHVCECTKNKCLDWLKKQCEQKLTSTIEPKFKVGDIVKSKSQPMLKPRKIISIGKDCYWCEDRGCIGFAWEYDLELVEQKPVALSENEIEIPVDVEDSELKEATYYIPKGFHAKIKGNKVIIKKNKKPVTWSENDETIKQWIISDIEKLLALNKKSSVIAVKEVNWLEFLQKRYTWNPSEEQINALDSTLQYSQVSHNSFKHLNSLFNDLKKLREG